MPISVPTPPGNALSSHLYDLKTLKNLTRTRQHPLVKELLSLEEQVLSRAHAAPDLSAFAADVARGFKLCFPNYSTVEFNAKKYIEIFSTPEHNLEPISNPPSTLIIRNEKYYIEVEGPQNTVLLPKGISPDSPVIIAACDAFVTSGIPLTGLALPKIAVSQGLLAGTQQLFMQEKGVIGTTAIIPDANSVKQIQYIKDDTGHCALHAMQLCYTVKPHPNVAKNPYTFYYKNTKTQEIEESVNAPLYEAISDAIRAQMETPTLSADNNILKIKYQGKILEIEPLISIQSVADLSEETPEIDLQTQINIHQKNIKITDGLYNPDWVPMFNFSPLPHTVTAYQWRTQEVMPPEEIRIQQTNFRALQEKVNQQQTLTPDEQLAYNKLTERLGLIATDYPRGFQLCLPSSEQDFIEFESNGIKQHFALQGPKKSIEFQDELSALAVTSYFVNEGMPLSSTQLLKIGRAQGLMAMGTGPINSNLKYIGQSVVPRGSITNMNLSKYEFIEDSTPECQFDATQIFYYILDQDGNYYYKDVGQNKLQKTTDIDPQTRFIKDAIAQINASTAKKERYFFTQEYNLDLKRPTQKSAATEKEIKQAAEEETLEHFATIEPLLCIQTHVEFGKRNDPNTDYTIEYDIFHSELHIDDPRLSPVMSASKTQTTLRGISTTLMNSGATAATNLATSIWRHTPSFRGKLESKAEVEHKHVTTEPNQVSTFKFSPLPYAVTTYHWDYKDTLFEKEIPMQKVDFKNLQLKVEQGNPLTQEEKIAYKKLTDGVKQIVGDCVRNWKLNLPSSKEDFIEININGIPTRFLLKGKEKNIVIPKPKQEFIIEAIVNHFIGGKIPLSTSQILKLGNSQGLIARPNEPVFSHLQYNGQHVIPASSSTIQDMHFSKYEYPSENTSECQLDTTQFFYCFIQEGIIYYKDTQKGFQEIDQEDTLFRALTDVINKVQYSETEHADYFSSKDKKLLLELEQEGRKVPVATVEPLLCIRTHIELIKKTDPHQNIDPNIYQTVTYDLFQPELTIDDPQLSLNPAIHGIGKLSAVLRSSIPTITVPTTAANVASTVWSYVPSLRRKQEHKGPSTTDSEPPLTMHIGTETKTPKTQEEQPPPSPTKPKSPDKKT